MIVRDALRPKSVLLDAALIAGTLVGANFLFGRDALGWTALNPSPYLLLPLLLGGRYGFTVGMLAGLSASALVATLQLASGAGTFFSALGAAPFLHASLVFLGGVSGELYGWFRRERAQATAQLDKLQTSVRRLDNDVRYLRGVKDELDRVVAARDGEVSSLDAELRRLYATARDELPAATLQFLKRQIRLADAAIYSVGGRGEPLARIAVLGREDHLPETLPLSASKMVKLALERGSLVVLPELLQQKEPPPHERLLLVAPLRDAHGRTLALLAIAGMPFINFNAQIANLVALICGWAGEVFDLSTGATTGRYRLVKGRESQRIFTREHFRHLLALSFEANQGHRLPSSVVVFHLRGAPSAEQARFEAVISSAIRAGDYAAELGHSEPHLAVLLPLVGERGASIFIERCKQFLRQHGTWPGTLDVKRIEIGRVTDLEELLAEVDGPSPAHALPA
jgi:hypothetical protein